MSFRHNSKLFILFALIGIVGALSTSNEAFAATRTWDGGGGDNNWTTAANWVGDVAPIAGDSLVFDLTGVGVRSLPNNDFINGTNFGSITISSAGYTLSGNSVSLTNGLSVGTYSSGTSAVSLIVGGPGSVTMSATGSGTLELSGVNTFAGGLFVRSGTVTALVSNKAFGGTSGAGTVTVGDTSGSADASLLVDKGGLTFANPIILATGTTGTLTVGNTGTSGMATTFSGGVTGTNNLTIGLHTTTGGVIFSTLAINNSGTVSTTGTGTGATTIYGGVGSNVTAIIKNSATSQLTIHTTPISVNSGGTTLINNANTNIISVPGGIIGTGDLILQNNGTINGGITLQTLVNNNGMVTNSGSGTGTVTVNGGIGSNVNSVTQNSITSALTVSGALTVNASGTTLTNVAGTKVLSMTGGVIGTGSLILNNNSSTSGGIAFTNKSINHTGTITNSGSGSGAVTNPVGVGENVTGVIQNSATSQLSITGTVTVNSSGTTFTKTGGGIGNMSLGTIIGTGNVIAQNNSTTNDGIIFTANNIGTVTNSGSGTGNVRVNVGANATSLVQNSATSTLSITNVVVNSGDTTFVNNAGALVSQFGGVSGTGNLILQNNSSTVHGITVSASSVNNTGTITNSGTGTGSSLISGVIGTNITGVIQNSGNSSLKLTGTNTYTAPSTITAGTLYVDGSQAGSPIVLNGGTLSGAGTVGSVTSTASGGTVSPGDNPKVLNSGQVDWSGGSTTFFVELNGTEAGTGYDQLNVAGTLNLNGATLSGTTSFSPSPGSTFTIINNDSTDAVIGTFAGLPEGSVMSINGLNLRISYIGGSNNDVVLTYVGPIDATRSTLLPTTASIVANGFSTQLLTVTARYADGSVAKVSGETVTITRSAGSGTIGAVIDNGDGTYSAIVTAPTSAGNGTFIATIAGASVMNDTEVQTETVITYTQEIIPTIQWTTSSSNPGEGSGTATLVAELSTSSLRTITADFAISGSAVSGGTDFSVLSTSISFPPGALTRNVVVTLTDDALDEDDETAIFTLTNLVHATPGDSMAHTLTILDNDAVPNLSWLAPAQTVEETSGSTIITAVLSAPSGKTITAALGVSGTAVNGTDYSYSPSSITFSPGATTANVTINLVADGLYEVDETVIFQLSNGVNTTITDGTDTLTITDNDAMPEVEWAVATVEVNEAVDTVLLTATLSTVSAVDAQATIGLTGTAAGAGVDYAYSPTAILIPAGQLSVDITVSVNDDLLDEYNETAIFTLTGSTHAVLGSVTAQTLTITDNDTPPEIEWTLSSFLFGQTSGITPITARLSAISGKDVTAQFSLSGTATGGGVDYTTPSSEVIIPAGSLNTDIFITVTDDTIDEYDETVILTLTDVTNATLGIETVIIMTIVDDDDPPIISWLSPVSFYDEDAGTVPVTATLSSPSGKDITTIFVLSGTAIGSGTDYSYIPTSISIPAGETSKTVDVLIENDEIYELEETIIFTLTEGVNVTISLANTHTLTILQDVLDFDSGRGETVTPSAHVEVNLLAPNSEASFMAGTVTTISWRTVGDVRHANLFYSVDNGATWVPIVNNIYAYAGSYLWTVPGVATQSARVKVELTNLDVVVAQSTSDVAFTISLPLMGQPPIVILTELASRFIGSFVKGRTSSTVYYVDPFAIRHPFFNPTIYYTYADSFRQILLLTDRELSRLPIDGSMPPKPGVVLVKFVSTYDTYVAMRNPEDDYRPILHHIPNEDIARSLFGVDWADYVIDLDVTSYSRFIFGRDVEMGDQFDKSIMKTRTQILEFSKD